LPRPVRTGAALRTVSGVSHTEGLGGRAVGLEELSDKFRTGERLLETFYEEAKAGEIQVPRDLLRNFLQRLVESYAGLTDQARGIRRVGLRCRARP